MNISYFEFKGIYWYKFIYYPTYNRLDGLLVGVSIAGIYQFSPDLWIKLSKYGNQFILLSLCILTAAYFLCEDLLTFKVSVFGFPLIALGFGFMVAGSISPTSFLYKMNSKITTFTAHLSFSIYLTHKGIIHTTHQLLKDYEIENNVMLLICMITCVLGAYILHLTVEKPFMKIRNKTIKEI